MPKQLSLLRADSRPLFDDQDLTIRESRRARRLILQVQPPHTVEVVVPRRTPRREVERFIATNQNWIRRAQEEIRRCYPDELRGLPKEIDLRAIQRRWRVEYPPNRGHRSRLTVGSKLLTVEIDDGQSHTARRLLRRWLMELARRELKPRLNALSAEIGLRHARTQIRTQRTRWGSCSSTGTISLNACLLFLDAPLVRYIMIQELCHLRHLDHSQRYWRLVASLEPDCRRLDGQLGDAWAQVPAWAIGR